MLVPSLAGQHTGTGARPVRLPQQARCGTRYWAAPCATAVVARQQPGVQYAVEMSHDVCVVAVSSIYQQQSGRQRTVSW